MNYEIRKGKGTESNAKDFFKIYSRKIRDNWTSESTAESVEN